MRVPVGTLGNRYRAAVDSTLAVSVLDLGLACCALEVGSAIRQGLLVPENGQEDPARADVLIISGTVTDALVPAVLRAWHALGPTRMAVSFGSCANTGGPYWDAPTVLKGVDQVIPIVVYVPGCPPHPESLIVGLQALMGEDQPS